MKLSLAASVDALLAERAAAAGLSVQEMARVLIAQGLGLLGSVAVPPGTSRDLQGPSEAPSSPPPSPSLDSPTPPSLPPPEQQKPCGAEGELVLFPDIAAVETAKEAARKKRDADREAELAWRISEVWEDFLFAREAFFRDVSGVKPGSVPELRLVRQDIRQALLIHDRDRLAIEDRDRWRRDSPVRAAGIGIFYDPWCAGTSPQNDARNGGKRYLEPWRPWKPQRGKPDPVTRFSELYFERRDQHEARSG